MMFRERSNDFSRFAGSLLLVLLIAGVLRLGWPDLVQFNLDEVKHLDRSLAVLSEGKPALVGSPSSVGPAKPPLMVYLLIPPLLVSRDPVVATGFVALLNVAAVIGCFWLTWEYFGPVAGLVAGLLFAASPWAVLFSRKIFTADLISPFTVLLFISLFAAFVRRKQRHLVLALIWLACLLQITFSTLPLAVLLVLLLALYRERVRPRFLAGGIIAGGLLFAPYLYYELTHGFANLRGLLQASAGPSRFDSLAVQFALSLVSGDNLHALAGQSATTFINQRPALTWLDQLEMLLFLGGTAYLLLVVAGNAFARRGNPHHPLKDTTPHVLLLGWILVPVLFNLRHSVDLYPHYFTLLYPAPYIVIGILAARVTRLVRQPPALAAVPILLILIIVAWQAYSVVFLYSFVQLHDTTGGYGVPLRFWKAATDSVRREAEARGLRDVVVVAEGNEPAYDAMPAILGYLLRPDLEARFLGPQSVLLPRSQDLVYLTTVEDAWLDGYLARFGRRLQSRQLPGDERSARVYLLAKRSWEELANVPQHAEQAAYQNGVHLWGYDLAGQVAPGQTVPLTLYWSFDALGAADVDESYSVFNHFVDATDEKWSQADGLAFPRYAWRDGDVLALGYDLSLAEDIPAGDYWVLTGIYSLNDGHRVAVLDQAGNPTSDAVRLGPVEVSRP
ncbi:MAG: ArnT family glycosyltransferase [Anaerolineae bacterium]